MATKQTIINIGSVALTTIFAGGAITIGGYYALRQPPIPTPAAFQSPAPMPTTPTKTHKTVDYYVTNPNERDEVIKRCNRDVYAAQNDGDCANAADAYFRVPSKYLN